MKLKSFLNIMIGIKYKGTMYIQLMAGTHPLVPLSNSILI
jgi:hypothetical protein